MQATANNTRAVELLEVRIRHHENLARHGDRHSSVYVMELRRELENAQDALVMEMEGWREARYHSFVDKSKRQPYKCGVCGRDITDPYHQPALPGTVAVVASRIEEPEEIEPEPVEVYSPQMSLF